MHLCWPTLGFKTPKGFLEVKECLHSIPPKAFTQATAAVEEANKKTGRTRMARHEAKPTIKSLSKSTVGPPTKEGKTQMKTEWESYLNQQLANPAVRQAYEEVSKVFSIGMELAKQRKRAGMTQAELAKEIGTSTPRLSRTKRRPKA